MVAPRTRMRIVETSGTFNQAICLATPFESDISDQTSVALIHMGPSTLKSLTPPATRIKHFLKKMCQPDRGCVDWLFC